MGVLSLPDVADDHEAQEDWGSQEDLEEVFWCESCVSHASACADVINLRATIVESGSCEERKEDIRFRTCDVFIIYTHHPADRPVSDEGLVHRLTPRMMKRSGLTKRLCRIVR